MKTSLKVLISLILIMISFYISNNKNNTQKFDLSYTIKKAIAQDEGGCNLCVVKQNNSIEFSCMYKDGGKSCSKVVKHPLFGTISISCDNAIICGN